MSVSRLYFMSSDAESSEAMQAALLKLADSVREIDGCESIQVLQDEDKDGRFLFFETWASKDKYAEGSKAVPADQLQAVRDLMAGKPEGGWFGHCQN